MSVFLLLLILSEVLLPNLTCASRVRRETTKVRISAIGDTITLKFLQPDIDTKLEGYILGYGRDLFSKQFMPLPEDGEPYETEIDAEPKYLVAVQPVKGDKVKKECAGNHNLKKPLHLVIGSVTPTSVMLSWGTLLNTLSTETNLDDCIDDGHYTVRYREKEPRKKWSYQTCPTTVTVIDKLKPETPYEFGVRAESENGVWSPPITHNTADRDINKAVVPENILKSMQKPITESPQASSPSVPGVSSVAPVSSAPFLQAKDMAIHKPVKSEKFPRPMKLNTESPQASSPSLPVLYTVTQSRPAYLHGPPAPPPIPRVTQDIHKPLKPEIFIKAEAPSTESPQDFSPSVPVLPIVMQTQSPASTPTHQSPTPTQRVNEDTHKPPTSENILMPDKPITESPQAFSPSVPIVHNVTHSRPASVLRHTAPPPIPRVTLGPGRDDIRTSSPSEDSLFLTQTLTSTHTPMHNLTTTNIQTHHSTTSSLSVSPQQPFHTTRSQMPTNKTLFNTPNTKTNTTKTAVSSTVKAQLNLTPTKRTQIKNPTEPQPESSTRKYQYIQPSTSSHPIKPFTVQLRTTQFQQHTAKYPLKTAQPKPRSPKPYIIHPQVILNQSQPSTTRGQLKMTLEPITKKSDPHSTQTQSITTQPQPKPLITQPQPSTTQSQPNTSQPLPITIQTQPRMTKAENKQGTTKTQPTTMQFYSQTNQPKPIKTQNKKIQQTTVKPKLTTTQSKPPKKQQKPIKQPQPIKTQSNTGNYQPNYRSSQQPVTKQNPKFLTKPKLAHERKTLEELSTTEFQKQPVIYPTSSTIKHFNTSTRQNYQTKLTLMTKPTQPVQTPSEKPNTHYLPWREEKPVTKTSPVSKKAPSQSLDGHLTKPVLVSGATDRNQGQDTSSTTDFLAHTSAPTVTKRFSTVSVPNPLRMPPTNSSAKTQAYYGKYWDKSHKGPKKPELNEIEKQTNQVDKDESDDKVIDLKVVGAVPDMKPSPAPPIMDQKTPTTTPFLAINGSRYNIGDNSSIFSSVPVSEVDPKGKKRFIAPHVIYQVDKPPEKPCSVTNALSHFPEEENEVTNISGPPKTAPTNLTVVTVEGCPSFVIIDWDGTDNETTAYEVTSSVKSPNGQVVSVVTTNQTHTAVENLKPESSYEFTVTPKNELGSGPSSEPVSFNTESADPRVSKVPTGKNAIWSSFSFKADGYSECTGTQYVKRTWYRKFVGIQLCNSLRYKIYLSDSLKGKFYNIGDEAGYGEDHCQFVDSFLDGRTGGLLPPHQLPLKQGFFRAMRQEPVRFGKIGGSTQINYVAWYECGVPIPGSW